FQCCLEARPALFPLESRNRQENPDRFRLDLAIQKNSLPFFLLGAVTVETCGPVFDRIRLYYHTAVAAELEPFFWVLLARNVECRGLNPAFIRTKVHLAQKDSFQMLKTKWNRRVGKATPQVARLDLKEVTRVVSTTFSFIGLIEV